MTNQPNQNPQNQLGEGSIVTMMFLQALEGKGYTPEKADSIFKAALKRCPDPCTIVQIGFAIECIINEEINYGL